MRVFLFLSNFSTASLTDRFWFCRHTTAYHRACASIVFILFPSTPTAARRFFSVFVGQDLGKNLAKYVVVINCSDGQDYKSVGRIFSGLVQSGSWGCFDEFNRIKIEVISVVAVQVSVLSDRATETCFRTAPPECACKATGLFYLSIGPILAECSVAIGHDRRGSARHLAFCGPRPLARETAPKTSTDEG